MAIDILLAVVRNNVVLNNIRRFIRQDTLLLLGPLLQIDQFQYFISGIVYHSVSEIFNIRFCTVL